MLSSMPGELVGKVVEVYPSGNDRCVITKDSEGAQWKGYKTWICNRDAEPTVLLNTTSAMSVEREEIFGPVVCAIPFDSAEEIPAVANQTRYGLAASIWTRDISKALRLAKALNVGGVWVNCCDVFDPNLPWGGFKQSGWGRELGQEGVETFTELKAITVKL